MNQTASCFGGKNFMEKEILKLGASHYSSCNGRPTSEGQCWSLGGPLSLQSVKLQVAWMEVLLGRGRKEARSSSSFRGRSAAYIKSGSTVLNWWQCFVRLWRRTIWCCIAVMMVWEVWSLHDCREKTEEEGKKSEQDELLQEMSFRLQGGIVKIEKVVVYEWIQVSRRLLPHPEKIRFGNFSLTETSFFVMFTHVRRLRRKKCFIFATMEGMERRMRHGQDKNKNKTPLIDTAA